MLKFFRVPFALSGTRTPVPDDADPSGYVSYIEGYGADYQRARTDPLSKNIERDKMNELFFDATSAIAELQAQGVPDFITSALNGGTAFGYSKNSLVKYSDGNLYVSLVAANTALPTDATKWQRFDDLITAGTGTKQNYTALRAYSGPATQMRITSAGLAGFFYVDAADTTSADNGGTVIVGTDLRRWKRLYDGPVNCRWFGMVGDGSTPDQAAITAALAAAAAVAYVPPGFLPALNATLTIPVGKVLQMQSGLGNTTGALPLTRFVKLASLNGDAIRVSDRAMLIGGGVTGISGNGGDGAVIIGNSATIRDFCADHMGGTGIRVGTDAGGNFNSFELTRCLSQNNGGRGFYIHDGKLGVGADANAGTLTECFAQFNAGNGIELGHCFWVTLINCLTEVNTGWGLYLSGTDDGNGIPQCRFANVFGGDFNEGNTAGQIFDQSYFSTFYNSDPNNVPTTAVGALPGSGRRNIFGTQNTARMTGLQITSVGGAYPLIVDDGTSGGVSLPVNVRKATSGANGDAAGFKVQLNSGSGYVDAGSFRATQFSANTYGFVLTGYAGGAVTTQLEANTTKPAVQTGSDNAWDLGSAAQRWRTVFAGTGAINTSDGREKLVRGDPSEAELRVAVRLAKMQRVFQFRDALAIKGEQARFHFGWVAQEVAEAFTAEGLDPTHYGPFCSDTWYEFAGREVQVDENGNYERVTYSWEEPTGETDESGQPVMGPVTYVQGTDPDRVVPEGARVFREKLAATQKTRLGLRENELSALVQRGIVKMIEGLGNV